MVHNQKILIKNPISDGKGFKFPCGKEFFYRDYRISDVAVRLHVRKCAVCSTEMEKIESCFGSSTEHIDVVRGVK